jgi:tRNA-guanine family transglycosylase
MNCNINYTPVLSFHEYFVLDYYTYGFVNPVYTTRKIPAKYANRVLLADSGGYQLFKAKCDHQRDPTIRCSVIDGVGIHNDNGIILDPIELCRRYGKLNAELGFTIDDPLISSNEEEFQHKISKGYDYATRILNYRKVLCPNTKILIPLHFATYEQLKICFSQFENLDADGYAFPVRKSAYISDTAKIAYVLCFLHSRGVKRVHLFGSSRPEIALISATAMAFNMFDQITFDSTTWNTYIWGKTYLDAITLKQKYLSRSYKIGDPLPFNHPISNDKLTYGDLTTGELRRLTSIHNVFAISDYTKNMTFEASEPENLKNYVKNNPTIFPKNEEIISAINILLITTSKSYKYLRKWVPWPI